MKIKYYLNNKVFCLMIGILLITVSIVKAEDSVYVISENQVIKEGVFRIVLNEPAKTIKIDNSSIYFYTSNFVYGANSSTGSLNYKVQIFNVSELILTDNYLVCKIPADIVKINKSSGMIEQKTKYTSNLDSIYSFFGVGSTTSTNIITNYYNTSYVNGSSIDNGSILINESQVNNLTRDLNLKLNKSQDKLTGYLDIDDNVIYNLHNVISSSTIDLESSSKTLLGSYFGDGNTSEISTDKGFTYLYTENTGAFNTLWLFPNSTMLEKDLNVSGHNITNCANCLTNETMIKDNSKVNKSGDTITGNISLISSTTDTSLDLNYALWSQHNGVTRTYLYRAFGIQEWKVNDSTQEIGWITYSTPAGGPGIVFYNANNPRLNRSDIRSTKNGLEFTASNNLSTFATSVMTLNRTTKALQLHTAGKGIEWRSPDGSPFCETISNLGVKVITPGTCT